jgi:hypothetical protein
MASEMDPAVAADEGEVVPPVLADDDLAVLEPESDAPQPLRLPDYALEGANDADVAEQLIPVPLDEDDYR